ncbi:MaoC family dehydratase [Calidifontibacter indicus]|uniref:Acyl dehydratase n=1 Tax=Calidifontibacter indicus TaxID=419650 RepID=A0A3D9US71_9MICO|nr:MaoC family dehydratase [Calidifontibacter indicus]REF32179.1 acyl dehydratase [Calidifontibacter indicus]
MRVINGVDELRAAVGEHLGYSSWHEVTQERIDQFAEATGDHQWIHVDPERAKDGPFGSTIAHGYLTLSMVPMLVWEVYRVDGVKMGVNYGSDKVRFPTPVPVGSKVRAGVELTAVDDIPLGVQVTAKVTVEIEGVQKPAMVAQTISVVVP